ncbi:Crp/Fnr family transcriptional regulator [Edaphobacter albus]|uniref:Crp/Fnr family transcriptional regulator n=1 Tax=Edaphobacter sp. 4G125 TaxID=2763071 RepID=UPI00210825E0|nr:Crp/Fnr family transcriptional regulator [Edaphobacter sp. 4G125]
MLEDNEKCAIFIMKHVANNVAIREDKHMSLARRLEVLGKSTLFGNVPEAALRDLASGGIEKKLSCGQILFTANNPSEGLYVVLSGAVRAFRVNMDGREQTIHIERCGGTLAEVAAFDGEPYPSTTIAEEDSEVLFLERQTVQRFMLQHPEVALTALRILAQKLRRVASLVEQLALMDLGQRLAHLLLEEAEKTGRPVEDGISFQQPLSHSQLAARLGSVREVVSRTLQKLTQYGIVQLNGRNMIIICNVKALRDFAKSHLR